MSDHDDKNNAWTGRKVTRRGRSDALKSIEYFSAIGKGTEVMVNSTFFQMVNNWLHKNSGLDLKTVVLGVGLFVATRTYTSNALKWLEEHGSNTLNIPAGEPLGEDLELWVAQQPMDQQTLRFLCLLPSFQNMTWKHVPTSSLSNHSSGWNNRNTATDDKRRGYSDYKFVASTGRSFFCFQGKLFVFEKAEYGESKLRCFWGNSDPIQALIKHVQHAAKHRGSLLQIHNVRGDGKLNTVQSRKRSFASIDMAPRKKQDL